MHIVPAPAESLMKSRVLSIPGLQGVMDGLGMDTGFSDFRQGWWDGARLPDTPASPMSREPGSHNAVSRWLATLGLMRE